MKKFKICRDEKIEKYLKIWLILNILIQIFTILISYLNSIAIAGIISSSLFTLIYQFIIFCFLHGKTVNIIYISDGAVVSGWIFPTRIKLTDIKDVSINNNIIISSSKKAIKLICYNDEENIKSYREILSLLENDSYVTCEIDTEKLVNNIVDSTHFNTQGKFDIVLKLILFNIISTFIYTTQTTIASMENGESSMTIILFSIASLFFLYVMLVYILKLSFTVKIAPIYFIVSPLILVISNISMISLGSISSYVQIAIYSTSFLVGLTIAAIAQRYFMISRTVKQTFVHKE